MDLTRVIEELGIEEKRIIKVKYSGHFKNFTANAKYNADKIEFNLSRQWKDIDKDIQVGLIQSLIVKIKKIRNIKTEDMKLYESFMKNLSKYAKKHTYDKELEESYERVNENMFQGMMDKPNLIFASESFNKLGSYEYSSDTIFMSTIFKDLPLNEKRFLDYVMYHELLHKKHSFNIKNGKHHAHTTAFREDEKRFNVSEQELTQWLRKKRRGFRLLDWGVISKHL